MNSIRRPRWARTIARVMLVAGVGLLAWSAIVWAREGRAVGALRARKAEREAELKTTRAELNAAGVRYLALQQSSPSVPDSVRAALRQEKRAEGRRMEGQIRRLEFQERDIVLDITHLKRRESQALARRNQRSLPFAIGGGTALAVAALVAALSRARPREAA